MAAVPQVRQGSSPVRGRPAARANQVPGQLEQPRDDRLQADRQHLPARRQPEIGQLEGTDVRDGDVGTAAHVLDQLLGERETHLPGGDAQRLRRALERAQFGWRGPGGDLDRSAAARFGIDPGDLPGEGAQRAPAAQARDRREQDGPGKDAQRERDLGAGAQRPQLELRLDRADGPPAQHAEELESLVLDELGRPLFVLDPESAQGGGAEVARGARAFQGLDGDPRETDGAVEPVGVGEDRPERLGRRGALHDALQVDRAPPHGRPPLKKDSSEGQEHPETGQSSTPSSSSEMSSSAGSR